MELLGYNVPLWVILISTLLTLFYRWSTSTYGTFKKINIPGPRPWPLIGNMIPMMFTKGIRGNQQDLRERFGNVVGMFLGRQPILVVYDVDVLKQIMVKEFSSFRNRNTGGMDYFPMNKMISMLKDDHWKHVRNVLTPTFSGSKLRRMVDQINKCGKTLTSNLDTAARAGDMFEGKEYSTSFTMDAIASTAFSLDVNSMQDKNNEFLLMARKVTDGGIRFIHLVYVLCPALLPVFEKFGVSIFPRDITDFIMGIMKRNIDEREKDSDKVPSDFLQLMLSAEVEEEEHGDDKEKSGDVKKSGLTHDEVLANAFIFFLAGFETVATALSMLMYCFATNPDCQQRAYEEITSVLTKGQDPTYDDIKQMKYVEMCLDESLRLFPPSPSVDRYINADIDINGVHFPEGITTSVPIYMLQNDPDVWPDPDKFDPERFTSEAKEARNPFYYMPFGMGPRNCIAQRLALLEIKMAIVHILRSFRVIPSEKTQVPVVMQKLQVQPINGNWLKVETRH